MLGRLRSKMASRTERFWPPCLQCLHLVHRLPSILVLPRVSRPKNGIPLQQRDIILIFLSNLITCIILSPLVDYHVFFFLPPCLLLGFLVSCLQHWIKYLYGLLRITLHFNHISNLILGNPLGNEIYAGTKVPLSLVRRLPTAIYHAQ